MAKHKELVGLQMLRGLCAAAVVVDHGAGMLSDAKYGGFTFLNGALAYGALGVDVFFVISAFIISMVVLGGPDLQPRMSALSFFEKRFTRIIPLMWIAILSYVAMQAVFVRSPIDVWGYARALVLWPDSYLKPSVIWTLRQEFVFYTLFCLSFFGPKILRWILLLWVLAPFAFVASLGSWSAPTSYIDTFASILFGTTNLEFGAGLIVGLFYVLRPPRKQLQLPVHPFVVIGGLMLASFVLCWFLRLTGQTLANNLLMGFLGALLVAFSARVACPEDLLSRLGKLLGDASYSIYLFHSHVLAIVLALRVKMHVEAPGTVVLMVVTLIALLAGIAISVFVERPVVRWAKSVLTARN